MYLLVSNANNTFIQAWVQGEVIVGQWKFDDKTPIPNFCPIIADYIDPEKIHLRARGSTSFDCWSARKKQIISLFVRLSSSVIYHQYILINSWLKYINFQLNSMLKMI